MVKASLTLKPVRSYNDGLSVYFLTGEKYLYQTLFCIASLTKYSDEKFDFRLIDDGSFNEKLIKTISKLLPDSKIYLNADIENNLKKRLPENALEKILSKRKEYAHIRKLTDIHSLTDGGWKLVLDSDMLFWANPVEIINWLKHPTSPIYMIDCEEAYGYSPALMEALTGSEIPKLLNVGIFGINSEMINWESLVSWINKMEDKEGKTYFLEQALSAMIVADKKGLALNATAYVVNPAKQASAETKLHHYVSASKKQYYNKAWKKFI